MNKRQRKTLVKFIMLNLIIILTSITYLIIRKYTGITLGCQLNRLTGLSCTGCGGTRMVVSLLQLDFYQAFRYNPYICLSLPFIAILYIRESYIYIKYKTFDNCLDKIVLTYGVFGILFGIVRNIPMFSYLLPTKI